MPASTSPHSITAITDAAQQDQREQPWKKVMASAAFNKPSSADDKEVVKTGGPCDVLTNFFAA
jgi:hypothetical protein